MADNQEIEKLEEATDMYALVTSYGIDLEKQGKNYKGLCPFHSEKTPSFIVSTDKKIAKCFGCGGGGRPINFIMKMEGIEFLEAANKLAKFNGMEFKGYSQNVKPVDQSTEKYRKIMTLAKDFYVTNLNMTEDGASAKIYLNERGLDDDIIKIFQVGLAPKTRSSLYNVLKESGYYEIDMADMSLVDKNENGYYDYFNNRITFPICDEMGNVIGFSGRIYNTTDKNQPKYINSRETPIFKKGEHLFNLHLAKGEIQKQKRVILHEGQMDVIAAYKAGFKEAVCSLGTALTESQVLKLKRFTNNAIICYDGDSAGRKAALKAIRLFKANGFIVHLVLLPDRMDPDEYVKKYGIDGYHDYFENNILDSISFIFDTAFIDKDLSDISVRESIKLDIFEMLYDSQSAVEVNEYLNKLAQRLNISLEVLTNDYNRRYNNRFNNGYEVSDFDYYDEPNINNQVIPAKPINKKYAKYECRLFKYAFAKREYALDIDSKIDLNGFSEDSLNLWIKLRNEYYEAKAEFSERLFIDMLNDEERTYYLAIKERIQHDKTNYCDEDMNECIAKLSEMSIKNANKKITKRIFEADSEDLQTQLINEKLKNRRKQESMKNNGRKN